MLGESGCDVARTKAYKVEGFRGRSWVVRVMHLHLIWRAGLSEKAGRKLEGCRGAELLTSFESGGANRYASPGAWQAACCCFLYHSSLPHHDEEDI